MEFKRDALCRRIAYDAPCVHLRMVLVWFIELPHRQSVEYANVTDVFCSRMVISKQVVNSVIQTLKHNLNTNS